MLTPFEYKYEYSLLTNAIVNVTDDCNLQCRYCFVEQNPHYMTLETAKAIADYLYNNLQKKKELKLIPNDAKGSYYFFGGEPMLQYQTIIKPIVIYCEEQYPNSFTYGLTTNGTLLSKESIDFFKKYDFGVMLSIDGIKAVQEYNRPCKNKELNSYDLIIKNIQYLVQQLPNTIFRSTAYSETIQYLFDSYLFAEKLGFKTWACIEDQRHPWTEEQLNTFKDQLEQIYFYRYNQLINHITPMNSWRQDFWMRMTIKLLLNNTNEKTHIDQEECLNRCGLATVSGAIGYDGSIYGCQEQSSKKSLENIFYVGNIFEKGIDIERHSKLLEFYYNTQNNIQNKKEECKYCPLKKLCSSNTMICPSSSMDLTQTMDYMSNINCFLRQIYYENSLLNLILFNYNQSDIDPFINQYLKNILIRKEC